MLFGIEQEIPLLRDDGKNFVDFSNTSDLELQKIIDELPVYASDYPILRVGDLGIKYKRWYMEGYERFDEQGKFIKTIPKGLEIRTTPHDTIDGALNELRESYAMLINHLNSSNFSPTWISFNPIHNQFQPDPPLNPYELQMRTGSPESQTAEIAELTFGPDLSLSFPDFSDAATIDAGKKLTFYSPYILPFSFSSPFADGKLWDGLSQRTFVRTGARPAVLVFLHDEKNMIESSPSLTQSSRISNETGRIEFKAFDTCRDLDLYKSLFILLQGIIFSDSLIGRALVPDAALHQRSAKAGFTDPTIATGAREVIAAARKALTGHPDIHELDRLDRMLDSNALPVYNLIKTYHDTGSVLETLKKYSNLNI